MELFNNFQIMVFKDLDLMSFIIVSMFISFIVMFWRAQATKALNWTDLLKKPGAREISLTKLIQLIGAMIATWIMVKITMDNKVTWDIFAIYLAYVGSVEGYSKFISAKYGLTPKPREETKEEEK